MAFFCLFPPLSPLFFVLSLLPSSHIRSALFRPFLCFFAISSLDPLPVHSLRARQPDPSPSHRPAPPCHSEEGLGPPKNLFSARFVSRPRASLSRPPLSVILSTPPCHSERSEESVSRLRRTPPRLRCFRPILPTPTHLGRPPHARTPPLHCFRPALPIAPPLHLGGPPHTHGGRSQPLRPGPCL